jgi:hypothetical protein
MMEKTYDVISKKGLHYIHLESCMPRKRLVQFGKRFGSIHLTL